MMVRDRTSLNITQLKERLLPWLMWLSWLIIVMGTQKLLIQFLVRAKVHFGSLIPTRGDVGGN